MQIVPELVIVYASYVEYKYTTEKSFANGPMLQPQDSYCNFVIKFFLSSFWNFFVLIPFAAFQLYPKTEEWNMGLVVCEQRMSDGYMRFCLAC